MDSPNALGAIMLSNGNNHGILQGQIGRSLSNERNGAWATNNNPKGVQ